MPNYLLVYRGGDQPTTPEEGAKVMAAWMSWFGDLGDAVVDAGNPTGGVGAISPDGLVSAIDHGAGVTGYSVLSAPDASMATGLAQGCPHLESGGTVEVYETFPVM